MGQTALHVVLGTALTVFPLYLVATAKQFVWKPSVVLVILFLALLALWGVYKLVIGLEILCEPTRGLFVLDKNKDVFFYRLKFFRKRSVTFDRIDAFELYRNEAIAESLHQGRTFRRKLYSHQLQLRLVDGSIKNVHTFSTRSFCIPVGYEKETFSNRAISKEIASLLARESGKKYQWLSKPRQAE